MKKGFLSGLLVLFLLTMVFSCSEQEEPQRQEHSLSSLITQATNAPVSEMDRSSIPSAPAEETGALSDATAQPESAQGTIASLLAGQAEATEAIVTNVAASETERSSILPTPKEGTGALPDATAEPESAQGTIASLLAGQAEATEAIATPRSALSSLLANAPTATSFTTNTIRPTVTPSRQPTATPRVSATPAPTHQPISASYIGNKNTKKFHRPDCGSVKQIAQKNVTSFSSREEAVNQGYQPCKRCKP